MIDVRLKADTNRGIRRWIATWRDPVTRKRRAKMLGKQSNLSRREAERLRDELQLELNGEAGLLASAPDGGETIGDLIDGYLLDRKADAAPSTLELFKNTGDHLERIFGRGRKVRAVEPLDAARARADLAKSLADLTVRKHVRNARQMWKWAMAPARRWATVNPWEGMPASVYAVDEERPYVSADDLEVMLDAAVVPDHRRLLALCRLAGLRLGEALRLEWDDLDWEQRTITVRNPSRRATTKKRRRLVPMEPWLNEILAADWTEATAAQVCQLTKGAATKRTQAVMAATGLAYRQAHHALRGSLETDWLARYDPMSVCAWLGHSPTIAAKHYHRPEVAMHQVTGASTKRPEGPIRPSSWSPSTRQPDAVS